MEISTAMGHKAQEGLYFLLLSPLTQIMASLASCATHTAGECNHSAVGTTHPHRTALPLPHNAKSTHCNVAVKRDFS